MSVSSRLRRYDQVLLDLDGTLWVGEEAVPRAAEAVSALRDAGKAVAFLTNDVRQAPEEFVRKLWRLGFQAALSEVVTAGAAVQYLLPERGGRGAGGGRGRGGAGGGGGGGGGRRGGGGGGGARHPPAVRLPRRRRGGRG